MKRIFALLSFILCVFCLAFSQPYPQPDLRFKDDGTFRIVQFTDLHLKYEDPASNIAFERIDQVLDAEQPDLVILTGDLVFSDNAAKSLYKALKIVSDKHIPFAITFGNHDDEFDATRQELFAVAQGLPYFVGQDEAPEVFGVGNCALPIYPAQGTAPAAVVYCFDSNAYSLIEGVKGYGHIHHDQLGWYIQRSKAFTAANGNVPLPALAYFHIPLREYDEALEDEWAPFFGIKREHVACGPLNSGAFTAFKEQGDIMGVFCGHEHDNDFATFWHGIMLAYGRFTGGNTVYNHLENGARVVELTQGSRTFHTWIRTVQGTQQHTVCPDEYIR